MTKVLSRSEEGVGPEQIEQIVKESLANQFESMELDSDWQEYNEVLPGQVGAGPPRARHHRISSSLLRMGPSLDHEQGLTSKGR